MIVGFDLIFPNNLTKGQWVLLREAERNSDIRENCPSQTHWTYDILTDNGRQIASELAKLHSSIVLISTPEPED